MKHFPTLPDYPIIDAHMHPYLAHDRNFNFAVPETFEEFFAVQKAAGIGLSCGTFNLAGAGKDPELLKICNSKVMEVHNKYPDQFYPGVNISPLQPELSCQIIEEFYHAGFRWIGELGYYIMGYEKYSLPGMKMILDLAEDLGMTVNLHPSQPDDIDELLSNFPNVRIVVAHPDGCGGVMKTYQLAQKRRNMYIDLSGSGLFRMGMLRRGVDLLGADRILFGTDYPVCNPAMNVAGVRFESLTTDEEKLIFRDNFLNLISHKN